jgi:hypothetical protein
MSARHLLLPVLLLAGPATADALDCNSLPPADFTICEDLASGSSGTALGGQFDGLGYVVSEWGAHLHWDLPAPIASGSASWTVDNLFWETWIGDNCLMFQLYDTGGHWGSTYGVEFRGYGPDSSYQGKLKLKFWGPTGFDECLVPDPGWDGSPHTFTVEWGEYARLYRDGVMLCDMAMGGQPWEFWQIDMPSQEWVYGYTGPIGARLRDLVVLGYGEQEPVPDELPSTVNAYDADLAVVADTAVASYLPSSVFPDEDDLACEGAEPLEAAYLRFDLSALPPAAITTATLRLTAGSSDSSAGDGATAYPVADDTWDEATLTYAARPPWGAALSSSGPNAAGAASTIDVTAAVQAAVDGGDSLVSFVLIGGDNGTHWDSKEAPGPTGPRLLLTWTEPESGDDDTAGDDDAGDDDAGGDDDAVGDDDTHGDDDTSATDSSDPEPQGWDGPGCDCGQSLDGGAALLLALPGLLRRRRR